MPLWYNILMDQARIFRVAVMGSKSHLAPLLFRREEDMKKQTARTAIALLAMALCAEVAAQAYPAKPIRWVVPYPPGGSTDVIARTVGQKLAEAWSIQVIIDNRPGASGMI